jgi:hypothetical protein
MLRMQLLPPTNWRIQSARSPRHLLACRPAMCCLASLVRILPVAYGIVSISFFPKNSTQSPKLSNKTGSNLATKHPCPRAHNMAAAAQ